MYALGSTRLADMSVFRRCRVCSARFHCFALPSAVISAVYVRTFGLTPACINSTRLSPFALTADFQKVPAPILSILFRSL